MVQNTVKIDKRRSRRAVVVDDTNLPGNGSTVQTTTSTMKRKKKGKRPSSMSQSSTSIPPLTRAVSTQSELPRLTPGPAAILPSGNRNEILSNVRSTPSSQSTNSNTSSSPLPLAALYGIIAAGVITLVLLLIFACVCFKRRRSKDRQTIDWFGVQEKNNSGAAYDGPGKGPGAKEMQLSDGDSYMEDEKYGDLDSTPTAPANILAKFPKLNNSTSREKPMEISKPFGMNFHVTNPDHAPPRPPRPSAHFDLSTSPSHVLTRANPIDEDDETETLDGGNEDVYERNILALTSSMAFDTPRLGRQSRMFDDTETMPDYGDLGSSMDNGRDTIVGFAESYAALASPLLPQDDVPPVRPLHIRNPSSARSLRRLPAQDHDFDASPANIEKLSEAPPTLSNVHIGLPASETTSMSDLQDVLGSFGRSGTPQERENPFESTRPVHHSSSPGGPTYTFENLKSSYVAPRIPAHKLNKPAGVEKGLSVVRNALSIHSTSGELMDVSPTQSMFPSAATSPNLSSISHVDSSETLVETNSGLQSRRVSFAIAETEEGYDTTKVRSLAELVRSKSLKRFNSNSDLKKGDLRGAFEQADTTTLSRLDYDGRGNTTLPTFGSRVRSSSFHGLSPALHSGWKIDRQRTSTAYGGQMPPTPLLHTPLVQDRRKTTDSEARFALGSHMLSVLDSPGGPEQPTPQLPYLKSPDLRIQPPSPSQASEITTFSALDRERDYQDRLAEQGFVPLGQMAMGAGSAHSQYYRSPIDSIVGVFEFDDPHHSAVINNVSLR